jgi:DNA polymerase III epsilon subunit family exonuclease
MPYSRLVSSSKVKSQIMDLLKVKPEGMSGREILRKVLKQPPTKSGEWILLATLAEDNRFTRDDSGMWHLQKQIPSDALIWERDYIAVDIEATGTDPAKHRVLEIGAVRLTPDGLGETFSALVNPERKIPSYISRMTGITSNIVKQAPLSKVVLPEFIEFLGDAVLVAHNAVFDSRFLRAEYALNFHDVFTNPVLCTLNLSRNLYKNKVTRFGLDSLCEEFHIEINDRHRALGDAVACGELFLVMLEELEHRGATKFADLLKYDRSGTFEGMIAVEAADPPADPSAESPADPSPEESSPAAQEG